MAPSARTTVLALTPATHQPMPPIRATRCTTSGSSGSLRFARASSPIGQLQRPAAHWPRSPARIACAHRGRPTGPVAAVPAVNGGLVGRRAAE